MQDERILALEAAETELERMQEIFRNINYQMRAMAGAPQYGAFSQNAAVQQFPDLAPLIAQKKNLSKQIRNQISRLHQNWAAFTMEELLTISLSHYGSPYYHTFYSLASLRLHDIRTSLQLTLYPLFHNNDYDALAHYNYPTIIQDLIAYRDIVAANQDLFPNDRNMPYIPQTLVGYQQIQDIVLLHGRALKDNVLAFMSASHRTSAPVARLTPDLLRLIARQTLLPSLDTNKKPWL